jgi:hypothetical protein
MRSTSPPHGHLTIAPLRGLRFADGLRAAVRADALSLVAFEIGLSPG